jgi:hypothetical protein
MAHRPLPGGIYPRKRRLGSLMGSWRLPHAAVSRQTRRQRGGEPLWKAGYFENYSIWVSFNLPSSLDIFALTRGNNLDTAAQSRPLRGQNLDVFAPCAPSPDTFALTRGNNLDTAAQSRPLRGQNLDISAPCAPSPDTFALTRGNNLDIFAPPRA